MCSDQRIIVRTVHLEIKTPTKFDFLYSFNVSRYGFEVLLLSIFTDLIGKHIVSLTRLAAYHKHHVPCRTIFECGVVSQQGFVLYIHHLHIRPSFQVPMLSLATQTRTPPKKGRFSTGISYLPSTPCCYRWLIESRRSSSVRNRKRRQEL